MKKYMGAVVMILLAATALSAQTRRSLYSQPHIPSGNDLDRLNLKEAWHAYLPVDGRRDGIFSYHMRDNQILILLRSGAVMALDAETGATQWRTRVGVPYVPAAGFGANSSNVFIAKGIDIFALERKNGNLLWAFALDKAPTAAPVADDEHIYVPEGTNRLNAYTLPKAEIAPAPVTVVEKKPEAAAPKTLAGMYEARQAASVLGSTRTVRSVGATGSGGKYVKSVGALSSATQSRSQTETFGKQPEYFWDYVTETRPETRIEQSSILTADFLFQAGANGLFFVISKFEPRIFYTFQADAPVSAGLGSHGEIAYVASEDYRIYALDIVTGKILWRFVTGGPIRQQPRVTDDSVYVSAQRAGMYRLDRATGNLIWNNAAAYRFLAANQKFVYAMDVHDTLLVLDRERGSQMASYAGVQDFAVPLSNELTDRIYLASNDGLLICLHDRANARPVRVKNVPELKPTIRQAEDKKPAPEKGPPAKPATAKPKDKDKGDEDK
jgi:outer membrane protein assembly factor BamB